MLQLDTLRESLKYEGGISRRWFMAYGAALASIPWMNRAALAQTRPRFDTNPFSLGIASGDPDSSSVVLWTRLAPKPLEPFGGMSKEPVQVSWVLADDDNMRNVVAKGTAIATPQLGHSVHVEVHGLKPDRWYWYRFRVGDVESPLGRTRTLPSADAVKDELKFAFASCQHFETGYYTAYQHMAENDLDLIFHLGDYIYEGGGRKDQVRQHIGSEIHSLNDYRVRHAQYRGDPQLQRAHSNCPWFVTWDDHEVSNNYAGEISAKENVDTAEFLLRRANAYQAYYENMPLRRRSLPTGPHMELYRSASFGQLAEFQILDTRQYRSDQPNGDRRSPLNEEALNPRNSLLGAKQRDWLQASLLQSQGTWNILAQQVMMGLVGFTKDSDPLSYSMDQWPGYAAERIALMQFMADRRIPNPIVLTGDIHSNWVNDLRVDDRNQETEIVATEFVGTSISSGGKGIDRREGHDQLLSQNPFIRFQNTQRGYVRCRVTPAEWRSDYLVVDDVTVADGKTSTRASFVVEAGQAGAKLV
ncbi:alkaline phosphatase D family protein [Schlesneria paludicola]|uniref:alkaline phosphatase D family protein n=1 Tax=Schlesneria paludicola TaxID=360056 RepID=UPI00058DFD35|nr:alkaline phosphatase D family protein [Schlesneria paludicola]